MNETLNLTFTTDAAMLFALAGTVATIVLICIGQGIKNSVKELSKTIRIKDFKLKPEFDKKTGTLHYEDSQFTPWSMPRLMW